MDSELQRGNDAVYIPKGYVFQYSWPYSTLMTGVQPQVISKQITGDAPWALRAVQVQAGLGATTQVQIQLPDGRFLENVPEDLASMACFGSWRRTFTREILCPVGSKISVTLVPWGAGANGLSVAMVFNGAYRYMRNGGRGPDDSAPRLPRYPIGENQNILAPRWMSGHGPGEPGDRLYTYASPLITQACFGVPPFGTISTTLRWGETFHLRRLLFAVAADALATGTFLVRVRADSGYALMDDYFDVAHLINGVPMACDWDLEPGCQIFFDYQLVDVAPGSSGNMYMQAYMEGATRRLKK